MIAKLYDALTKVRIHQASSRVTAVGGKYLHLAQPTWLSALDGYITNFIYEANGVICQGELSGEAGCKYKYLLPTATKHWSIALPPIYVLNKDEFLMNLEELRKNVCSLVLVAESTTHHMNIFERERVRTDMFIILPKPATESSLQQSFSVKYFLEKLLEHLIINNFYYDSVVEVPQFMNVNNTNNFAGEFLIYRGYLTWYKS